ncbi:MAG: endonuclease domain-containing protein [bacterium]|nr:endonuclease domain-containing protein [bacterium]
MSDVTTTRVPEALRCELLTVEGARFEAPSGVLRLSMRFDEEEPVVETVQFPGGPFELDDDQVRVIERLGLMLAAVASTSYFKARLARMVRVEGAVGERGRALIEGVFAQGLAEFAYRNGLGAIAPGFEFAGTALPELEGGASGSGWLVALGGGKDSVVALEMLREAEEAATAVCVGGYEPVRACAEASGVELVEIERRLAPELAAWNQAGAPNGHVPVTAINSLILLIQAVLRGAQGVVMANERSAEEPTVQDEALGAVNHQYSKSLAFERALRAWLEEERIGLEYFSVLRPWSELAICRRFAGLPAYHGAFVSCNAAYRRDVDRRSARWCGDCAKCRFVFLGLAPFMGPEELVAIFGSDMLRDESQADGFAALLSPEAKPFECVGTRAEVRAAFGLLLAQEKWRDAPVVRSVAERFGITPFKFEHAKAVLEPSSEHLIPDGIAMRVGVPRSSLR